MRSIYVLAWRSIREKPVRSILSVFAVMLGVAVMIAGSTIAESVREGILQSDEMRAIMEGLINMLDPAMIFIGLAVMMAGGFLIFNTFSMSITQRRQQIGGLRALGMTRAQVMRVIMAEGVFLAVIGLILGVLISNPLAQAILAFVKSMIGKLLAFGDASPRIEIIVVAVVMGLLIVGVSVYLPTRRASHISPLDALREAQATGVEHASRPWGLLGLSLIFVILVIDILSPPAEWVTFPMDVLLTMAFVVLWFIGVSLVLPGIIGLSATLGKRLFKGVSGRIVSDNLSRARGRVTLTVMTLTFAILVLIGLTGFLKFFLTYGFGQTMETAKDREAMFVSRINMDPEGGGWGEVVARGLDSIMLSNEERQAVTEVVGERGDIAEIYLAVVPETSLFGSVYYSYVIDPSLLFNTGDTIFSFTEGDWETALPIMREGCGVLVSPMVAQRLGIQVGETTTITGLEGPIDCVLAGIGSSVAGASIVSATVREQVTEMNPTMMFVVPGMNTNLDDLIADLEALKAEYPEINVNTMRVFLNMIDMATDLMSVSMNAMLLLAALAAAFGVVNTVMISVDERRQEIGLLRAVGTTRTQTHRIIIGEAIFMGFIGGVTGFFAGLGIVVVIVMTYGFSSFGVTLDLWEVTGASIQSAMITGGIGLIVAPLISGIAAWFPARNTLEKQTIVTLTQSRS